MILVDAGHGGTDPGMIGVGGLKEKEINLEIANRLKKVLEEKGYYVIMTRKEDKGLYDNDCKNQKVAGSAEANRADWKIQASFMCKHSSEQLPGS